jgi:hypothetical protein
MGPAAASSHGSGRLSPAIASHHRSGHLEPGRPSHHGSGRSEPDHPSCHEHHNRAGLAGVGEDEREELSWGADPRERERGVLGKK